MVKPNMSEFWVAVGKARGIQEMRAREAACKAAGMAHSAREIERKRGSVELRVKHLANKALDGMP